MSEPQYQRDDWGSRTDDRAAAASRRQSDEMLDHVSRSEAETAGISRRLEEQLRGLARRIDSSERSQSESNRVISKAAVEMNIASREQAQAFDQLGTHVSAIAERLDRVERHGSGDSLRDAVKALHNGLSRLADQIAATANQSATQISTLAGNLESVAGRLGQARLDSEASVQALDGRIAQMDERLHTVEKTALANAGALERAMQVVESSQALRRDDSALAIKQLQEGLSRLEAESSNPALDRRLSGIERALSEIAGRVEIEEHKPETVEDGLKKLAQRLDALDAANREAMAELRKAITDKPAAPVAPPAAAPVAPPAAPPIAQAAPEPPLNLGGFANPDPSFAPLPPFDAPPFADAQARPLFAEVPPHAFDNAGSFGSENPFAPGAAGQNFGTEAIAPPPPTTVDSYLSAARRSARAATQAEVERGSGAIGGMGWSAPGARTARKRSGATVYIVIGVLALVAIAVVAGAILSRQVASVPQPNSAIGAMIQKKAPAPQIKSLPQEPTVQDDETGAPTTDEMSKPAPAAPKPAVKAAAPTTTAAAPAHTATTPAPGSPRLAAQSTVPQKAPVTTAPQPQQQAPAKPAPAPMTALDKLTAMANAGNAKAELVVGLKYLDGDGVPVNDAQAAKWLDRAAQAGEPVAQYRIGTMYERGRSMTADPAKAAKWYLAAANQGNRKAMHNLAVAYAQGSGVTKDYAEAARWFSRAANLGLSDSQFNLAVLYERGLGVPQGLIDAYKWYAIAAAQGDNESKNRLGALATQLDPEGRAAAQHAADSFKPGELNARANVAPSLASLTRG